MKKSGVLMLVGPLVMISGLFYSEQISRLLIGSVDYGSRIATISMLAGVLIFLLGCILLVKENRSSGPNQKALQGNKILQLTGVIVFVLVIFFIFRLMSGVSGL